MTQNTGYKARLKDIKEALAHCEEEPLKMTKVTSQRHVCQTHHSPPIIIQKSSAKRKTNTTTPILAVPEPVFYSPRSSKLARSQVQKFEPILVPKREARKIDDPPLQLNKSQEIEIIIQDSHKDCIKKLFKKVTRLTQELAESQKLRTLAELELKNRVKFQDRSGDSDESLKKLEIENHKLRLQVESLRQQFSFQRLKAPRIVQKIVNTPIQIIRQVPIQKLVQVKVDVPKYIPGPERIVQKIIQVPKYIEVQKSVPKIQYKEVIKQVIKIVPEVVEKTVYVDKPVYIEKPVYVDKVVEKVVEVPVNVPFEVPIYLNTNSEAAEAELRNVMVKVSSLEKEILVITGDNEGLRRENSQLLNNLEILKRHNEEKNREVEGLLRSDYENRRGISILREMSGLPSSQFSSTFQGYSLTAQNFNPSSAF